jgi:hypothetical protein
MDNVQFWIYVIIGIIYLISRSRKKQDKAPPDFPEVERPSRQSGSEQKPITFEELLREITEAKEPEPKQVFSPPQPKAVEKKIEKSFPTYEDYDGNIEPEEKNLEEIPPSYRKKDRIYDVYEEAKRQAFNRPSLEETMKLEDTVVRYSRFKEFEIQESRNLLDEYTKDLNNPEGLKRMVVMAEILNRKHF